MVAAFLNKVAHHYVFNISLSSMLTDTVFHEEDCLSQPFVIHFAGAMNGALMSSDTQVQITSLQLICHMCPPGAAIIEELQILIEEGLTDHIFELLKVSGK